MDGPSRTLYVENFPLNSTTSLIQKLFAHFGHVKGVDLPTFDATHPMCRGLPVPKAKGYAFVEFASSTEAQDACKFFNDLSYILSAATKLLGKSELTTKIDRALAVAQTTRSPPEEAQSTADLRQSLLLNLEFRKLLLIRVMTKDEFQKLAVRYNDQKFQSSVRAAKMLIVSS